MVVRQQVSRPPRLAEAILTMLADRQDRACLIGDLAEEYRDVSLAQGGGTASRWYWNQAVRSVGPLLLSKLTSDGMVRSLGAMAVGFMAAVGSATLFGLALAKVIAVDSDPSLPVIALVVTSCALVSSTCAGWASTRVSGQLTRCVMLLIGLVVVAPDLAYAVRHHNAYGLPWALFPPSLAMLATWVGLTLGTRLCRLQPYS